MSSSYYAYRPQATPSYPVDVPGKRLDHSYGGPRHQRGASDYSQYSISPPEHPKSISTASGSRVFSSASSNHDASSDYETSAGADSLDLLDYMRDRLTTAYDPVRMDRSLASQAQRSGELNAKQRELLALQAQARSRLSQTRAKYADGMQAAREVRRDLEWTQKKVSSLNARAAAKYPEQYRSARHRYPAVGEV